MNRLVVWMEDEDERIGMTELDLYWLRTSVKRSWIGY